MRFAATVTRLSGVLDIDVFHRSVERNVDRHDALRTHIVIRDGEPIQEISETIDWNLEIENLSANIDRHREIAVSNRIERIILQPIDIANDPMFEVRLLRVSEDEHVLIIATEHIISDMSSLQILLRDVLTAYTQDMSNQTISLPEVSVQFHEYATWQRANEKLWVATHGSYWSRRLSGCGRLRFPTDTVPSHDADSGWSTASIRIGNALRAELGEYCRQRATTIAMSVFTAYVALVLRWCSASEGVIQFMSNSRSGWQMENTFGCFATPLFLRMTLSREDCFDTLLERVTEECCNAYEHADFSYLESQLPRPDFSRSTIFNWVPYRVQKEHPGRGTVESLIKCSPVLFEQPLLKVLERDSEPFVVLFDTADETAGSIYFPLNRFSLGTMERFARNFIMFTEMLINESTKRINDIALL